MAQLIWSPTAIKDIGNIAAYIAKDSLQAATLQTERFFEKAITLEKYPLIGTIVPELKDKQYRQLLVNRFRLIYKVVSKMSFMF